MSVRVLTDVWDSGLYHGGMLLVLLAMADWADDRGGNIFPTISTLARKARLTERAVQSAIEKLKEDGIVEVVAKASGRPGMANEYRIAIEKLKDTKLLPARATERRTRRTAINSPVMNTSDGTEGAPEHNAPSEDQDRGVNLPTENGIKCTREIGDKDGCSLEQEGVKPEAGRVNLATAHIEEPSLEPSKDPSPHPSLARASESKLSVVPKADDIPPFLLKDPIERFMVAAPWHPASNRSESRKAWDEIAEPRPSAEDALAAAGRYAEHMRAENAKRRKDDPAPLVAAHTFLRKRMWEDYPAPPAVEVPPKEIATLWESYPDEERQLRAEVGDGIFNTWLAPCHPRFDEGFDSVMLHVPSRLVRDYVSGKLMARVERAFFPMAVGLASGLLEAPAKVA